MAKRRANGEGNLRKRKDGRWEGRYTAGHDPETGKAIYRNVLGRTQAEARAKLKQAIEEAKHGQSDFFIDDSWVLINNLQANLYYSYSSNSFHDIYQTTYTFMDGEDIYFFTNQGRTGTVLGYVTYDRGYYKVDNCIVYQIDSGTTSDDEVYEFTADEFSEIQIGDSVVSKYRDITLRITGVEVSNINTKEGSFRSNIQNRLVLLLDPREISNLTDGDIISIDCKIGFAMVRGYVFYDAVVVN